MKTIEPTMLWEATDPQVALQERFRFASGDEASRWLLTTLAELYYVEVTSVDRLVISASNLLAWLTTTNGLLLAKCSAALTAHERLTNVADLLVWLAQRGVPVSVPILSCDGTYQVRTTNLSIGVQRLLTGTLLDTTVAEQVHAAGITLAQLHQQLALYPRAADFAPESPIPNLAEIIGYWAANRATAIHDPELLAGVATLLHAVEMDTATALTAQLIHRDYRAANLLWHAGKIAAVLDFEDLLWNYRVNDLAWAAVHLGTRYHHWGPVPDQVHDMFLAAYMSQHPLTEAERTWLPRLMLWHSINLAVAAAGGENFDGAVAAVARYAQQLNKSTRPE